MQPFTPVHVVVTDANILINLMHAGRLGLLEDFSNFSFTVPNHVLEEVNRPAQAEQLQALLAREIVRQEVIADPHEIPFMPSYTR